MMFSIKTGQNRRLINIDRFVMVMNGPAVDVTRGTLTLPT